MTSTNGDNTDFGALIHKANELLEKHGRLVAETEDAVGDIEEKAKKAVDDIEKKAEEDAKKAKEDAKKAKEAARKRGREAIQESLSELSGIVDSAERMVKKQKLAVDTDEKTIRDNKAKLEKLPTLKVELKAVADPFNDIRKKFCKPSLLNHDGSVKKHLVCSTKTALVGAADLTVNDGNVVVSNNLTSEVVLTPEASEFLVATVRFTTKKAEYDGLNQLEAQTKYLEKDVVEKKKAYNEVKKEFDDIKGQVDEIKSEYPDSDSEGENAGGGEDSDTTEQD